MKKTSRTAAIPTNAVPVMRTVMGAHGVTQASLAKLIGYATTSGVSERLRSDIRVGTLVQMLNALGCDLVIVDRSGVVSPQTVVITGGEETE